jgi:hypothetical protein
LVLPRREESMSFFIRTLLVLVLLALGGGSVFLATWDIPPPTAAVEKVIPNARFPR